MRKRYFIVGTMGLLGIVVAFILLGMRQPSFGRIPLSDWLDQLESKSQEERQAATLAVIEIVSRSPTSIVELIHTEDSGFKLWVNQLLEKQKWTSFRFKTSNQHRLQALSAFQAMKEAGAPAVSALIESCQSDDPDVRNLAVRLLQPIGSAATNAIPTLCDALADQSQSVARNAAETLAGIGSAAGPKTVTALRPLVNDTRIDAETRGNLIEALQAFPTEAHHVLPELMQAIQVGNAHVRRHSIQVIGNIGPPKANSAIPMLISALDDPDEEIQSAVLETLEPFGPLAVAATPSLLKLSEQGNLDAVGVMTAVKSPPAQIREPFMKLWKSGAEKGGFNLEIRDWFARLGEEALPDLIPELNHTNLLFCEQVLEVLGNIGPAAEPAVESIHEILEDPTRQNLHFKAAWELGRIESSVMEIFPVLMEPMRSDDFAERYKSVVAFMQIHPIPESGIHALIGRLKDDPNPHLRKSAARALENRLAHEALITPALIEALDDVDAGVRKASLQALKSYPEALRKALLKISSMLDDESDGVCIEAIKALGAIGSAARTEISRLVVMMKDSTYVARRGKEYMEQRRQELEQSMKPAPFSYSHRSFLYPNPARDLKSEAAEALGFIGEQEALVVPALIEAMGDTDTRLRSKAAFALGRYRARASSSIPVLRKALADTDETVRKSAAIAWIMVSPVTLDRIQYLVRMAMHDEGNTAQFRAVEALECMGPDAKAAIPALRKLQKTTQYSGIRLRAERALRSIDSENSLSQ